MAEAKRQPRVTESKVTHAQIHRICGAAIAHWDTVVKFLNGGKIKGDVGVRIAQAAEKELGMR